MMKAPLTALAAAAAAALVVAAPSVEAGGPIVAKVIAQGTLAAPITIKAKPGAMIVESYTVKPGGSFGWHVHGSPVAVVVASGTLTVFDPAVGNCKPFKVSKGASFFEPANHIHLARNDTSKPVVVYAMYLGVPKSGEPNVGETQPAGCNA